MRFLDSEAQAASWISAPSSSRKLDLIDDAMQRATSSGRADRFDRRLLAQDRDPDLELGRLECR